MTDQQTDERTDLAVQQRGWTPGTPDAGLDERVEFAHQADGVLVRDPRHPEGPQLRFSPDQWTALLTAPPAGGGDAPDAGAVLDLRESSDLPS
jgi:hypothetical protein